jgi:hypothetical protein
MGFFDSGSPSITVAVDVLFPSNVVSGPGVAVDKTNAVWSVGLDYVDLTENTSISTPSGYFVAVWDAALARYEKVRLDNLNLPTLVDFRAPLSDANYAASVNDRYLGLTATLTAIRTITLPGAATVPPGRQLVLQDEVGGVSQAFYHSIVPTGTDTINGGASWLQKTKRGGVVFRSNGSNAWNVLILEERTPVADAPYVASFGDSVIAYTSLSAARSVTLPAAAAYPVGKRLTIVDESGNCSSTFTIGILRAGSDTINGAASISIALPYGFVALESDGVSKWTIVDADTTQAGHNIAQAASVQVQRQLLRIDQHTTVADANYTALSTDQLVAYTSITAARIVTLPAAATVNAGQPIVIADESGSCSATNTITVTRIGSDTINGQASAVIANPFGYLELVSNGANKWTLIDTSITSANIADASASGRSILAAPSIAATRGLIIDQRTPVADANYAILNTDRYVATSAALSAPRIWTLPPASTMNAGQEIVIYDEAGAVTAANTLTILRSGTDTVNGAASFVLNRAFQGISLRTDGVGKWAFEDEAGPIDGTPIGATTPSTGAFTTLSASGSATFNGAASFSGVTSLPSSTTINGGGLPIRGYLGGLTLSNDGTNPNTVIDVSAGACASDDAALIMSLGAFSKSISAAWSVGSGSAFGGLDTGTVAASTWYHVYVIERTDTGVVDVLISLSATSPTMPANYTKKRRIGSIKTDASSHILLFSQNGDESLWLVPVQDVNTTSLGTTATNFVLGSVPTGVKVNALTSMFFFLSSAAGFVYVSSLDVTDEPTNTTFISTEQPGVGVAPVWLMEIRTNTSGQIRARANQAPANFIVNTLGWKDTRGRLN